MKWPFVLRAHRARTFSRSHAFENERRSSPKMRKDWAGEGVAGVPARRCIDENRFTAARRADGDIDLASRHIRNSISLTMQHARRMICASHQSGGGSADEEYSLNAAP